MGFPSKRRFFMALFEPEHMASNNKNELNSCMSAKSKLDELLAKTQLIQHAVKSAKFDKWRARPTSCIFISKP